MIGKNVRKFCCEDISLIENYEKAINSSEQYICHHRLGIDLQKSKNELIEMGLYYNRPAKELLFLTVSEHFAIHNTVTKVGATPWNKGKTDIYSEETRNKMGQQKGCITWMKGKHHSEETKRKLSKAHKEKPSSTKGKKYDRYKCITSDGQIKIMPINVIHRYHWEIIKED